MQRRLDLGTTIVDIVGGCWWGKRRREPYLLAMPVLDLNDPPHDPTKVILECWKHIGEGVLIYEGITSPTFSERWNASPAGGEFKFRGINIRMTDEEVEAQLPDLRDRQGLEAVREAVQEERWDDAEKLLGVLDERTPEYLHLLEEEHWLTLYKHRPALRRLNMGFV